MLMPLGARAAVNNVDGGGGRGEGESQPGRTAEATASGSSQQQPNSVVAEEVRSSTAALQAATSAPQTPLELAASVATAVPGPHHHSSSPGAERHTATGTRRVQQAEYVRHLVSSDRATVCLQEYMYSVVKPPCRQTKVSYDIAAHVAT